MDERASVCLSNGVFGLSVRALVVSGQALEKSKKVKKVDFVKVCPGITFE
jgi:hypothetical protein